VFEPSIRDNHRRTMTVIGETLDTHLGAPRRPAVDHVGQRHEAQLLVLALLVSALLVVSARAPATATAASGWVTPTTLFQAADSDPATIAIDASGNTLATWARSNGANEIVETAFRPAGGAFSAPVQLSAPGEDASCPALATDTAGDATIAWLRSNGTNKVVEAATRPAGSAFSSPVALSAPGEDASCPQVVVGQGGNSTAVWSSNEVVHASVRPAGGQFSPAVNLSASGAGETDLSGNARGDATVAWMRFNGTRTLVEAATRPASGVFGASSTIASQGANPEDLNLAVAPSGTATIEWTGGETEDAIEVATRTLAGVQEAPTVLAEESGRFLFFGSVSLDPRGGALVSWLSFDYIGSGPVSTGLAVEAATRAGERSGWEPTQVVWRGPSPGPAGRGLLFLTQDGPPRSAIDANGDTMIAWTTVADTVLAATGSAGGAFSSPVAVSNPAETVSGSPQILQDAAGDTTVLWNASPEPGPCGCAIESATMPAKRTFSQPIAVSSTGASMGGLAMDPTGDGAVTWTQPDGSSIDTDLAGFEMTPPALGALNVPASGVAGTPIAFSAAPTSIWSSLSTTWSWGDGTVDTDGAAVMHAFAAAGTYTVTVSSTDELGNLVNAARTITISPAVATHVTTATPVSPGTGRVRTVGQFKVGLSAVKVSHHTGELRVTEIVILGTTRGNLVSVSCNRCRDTPALRPIVAHADKTVFRLQSLVLRESSTLIVHITARGLEGRFKAYGHFKVTYPKPSHPLLSWAFHEQGCLAVASTKRVACPT
jgi:PKD repeat protein